MWTKQCIRIIVQTDVNNIKKILVSSARALKIFLGIGRVFNLVNENILRF